MHLKKRKKLLKAVKGYKWGRKKTIKLARPAMLKAGVYAYRDRRNKKRNFRALWQIQISAACKALGLSYSKFINKLNIGHVELDRKILSLLARENPTIFAKIVEKVNV